MTGANPVVSATVSPASFKPWIASAAPGISATPSSATISAYAASNAAVACRAATASPSARYRKTSSLDCPMVFLT